MFGRRRWARIEGHEDRLYGFAFALTNDAALSEDLVQETLTRALGAKRVPHDAPAVRAWLFRILRNAVIDMRRRRKEDLLGDRPEETPPSAVDWGFADRVINQLTVRTAFDRLSDNQREIIALVDVAGMSYAEAAQTLEVPVGTVMSRISRARTALADAIESGNIRPMRQRNGRPRS